MKHHPCRPSALGAFSGYAAECCGLDLAVLQISLLTPNITVFSLHFEYCFGYVLSSNASYWASLQNNPQTSDSDFARVKKRDLPSIIALSVIHTLVGVQ